MFLLTVTDFGRPCGNVNIKIKEEMISSHIVVILLYLTWAKFGKHVNIFFFAQTHV